MILTLLFLLFPVPSLPLLIFFAIRERFQNKRTLFFISFSLCLIGYAYLPDSSKDIFRHYLTVATMQQGGFQSLLYFLSERGGPALFYLFSYFCAKINLFNLMPLVIVTCFYYLYFLGIREIFIRYNFTDRLYITLVLLWVFSTISYPFAMTNLRQPLAVGFIFYVLCKNNISYFLFVILMIATPLFHVSGYLLILCLGMTYLLLEKKIKLFFIFSIIILSGYSLSYLYGYDTQIESKIDMYSETSVTALEFIKYVALSYINLFLIACILLHFLLKRRIPKNGYFTLLFVSAALLFISNPIVFQRLMFFAPLFFIPVTVSYLMEKRNIFFPPILFSIIMTILYGIRLTIANFGGYKYWHGIYYRDVFSILILAGKNFSNYWF